MKKIVAIAMLTAVLAATLALPDAHAKRDSRDFGYRNWAEFCRGSAAATQSAGFDLTVGECVCANESANPAMLACQQMQFKYGEAFEDIFGNFGQCLKAYNDFLEGR